MVNGKIEVCEKRGPRQKYYYHLISIFGNIILAEKKYTYTQAKSGVAKRSTTVLKNM
jgi:hypothetical protein